MTVLVVTSAVFTAIIVLGLVGDGSMNFYAMAVREATHRRDNAERPRTRRRVRGRSDGTRSDYR